jgi:chaperone modulatory protein CbpM
MTEILLKVTVHELCQYDSLSESLILEIVEHGIAQPIAGSGIADWVFDTANAHWLQKAARLHHDLEVDWIAVAMVIDLLQQKEALERKNLYFEKQLQRFLQ